VFQVDLFSARGVLPRDIHDVMARYKDIMYSSRTRHNTDVYRKTHNLKVRLYKALSRISEDQLSEEERELKRALGHLPEIAILQLIYQQKAYEGDSKDHEFSHLDARALDERLRGYQTHAEAARLDQNAGRRHGHHHSRRASRE
jgi:NTE family protein